MLQLELQIEGELDLSAQVEKELRLEFVSGAVEVYPEGTVYEGPYVFTPTLTGFDIETDGKFMEDDVTINPIPIAQASNPQGGYTYTIG